MQAQYGAALTASDRAAHRYFANFAKTGDPDDAALPLWPAQAAGGDPLLDFSLDQGPQPGPGRWQVRLDLTTPADPPIAAPAPLTTGPSR